MTAQKAKPGYLFTVDATHRSSRGPLVNGAWQEQTASAKGQLQELLDFERQAVPLVEASASFLGKPEASRALDWV